MKLTNIKITKLWGSKSYDIKIKDNKLIVVGENGSGKSTILKLIYLFLSKQWDRINEIQFEKIETIIDGETYELKSSQVRDELSEEDKKSLIAENSDFGNVLEKISHMLLEEKISELRQPLRILSISDSTGLSEVTLNAFFKSLYKIKFGNIIFNFDIPVFYLPTYRRTELQLNKFLSQFKVFQDDVNNKTDATVYINVIIEELEKAFRNKWDDVKEKFLELAEFGLSDVFYLLEKEVKKEVISENLKLFVSVSNKYLNNKEIFIVDNSFNVKLKETELTEYLEEDLFSSGEKQIISIFFYLTMSDRKYFVIIDEPELSISMFWQERILTDIMALNCSGLLASTHSPFIFKKNLRSYTYSFENFRRIN